MSALGRLVASVVLDTAEFTAGADKAQYQAAKLAGNVDRAIGGLEKSLKSSMVGMAGALAAGFSVVAIKTWIDETVAANAALDDMAEKTGATVEQLSGFVNVAKVGGHDVATMEQAMAKLAKGMVNADEETKGAGKALAFLGISATDANGKLKNSADLTQEIAKKFAEYEDGAGKAAIAQTLFGKSGAQLLPFLKDLAEGTDNVIKVTARQAAEAEAYEKNLRRLAIAKGDLIRTIAQEAIPVLNTMAEMYLKAKTATDGTLESTRALASDGTLREWAEKAAYGAAFVVDAFNSVIVVVKATGEAIAGTVRIQGLMTEMAGAMGRGDFGTAVQIAGQLRDVQAQTAEQIDRILSKHKSIRFELDEQLKRQREIDRIVGKYAGQDYRDQNDRRGGTKTLDWKGDGGSAKLKEAKSDLGDIDKLLAGIYAKEAGFDADFGEKVAKLTTAWRVGKISLGEYTVAMALLTQQQPGVKKGIEEQAKALEYYHKWLTKVRELELAEIDARDAAIDKLEDGNDRLKIEIETLGMTAAEREKYILGLEEEAALKTALSGKDEEYIRSLANERRALIDRKTQMESEARLWGELSDRAGAFFGDLVVNGKSAFDRLRDSLKSFAAELIALFAKRWILNMIAGPQAAAAAGQGTLAGTLLSKVPPGVQEAGLYALGGGLGGYLGARAMGAGQHGQNVGAGAGAAGAIIGAAIAGPIGAAIGALGGAIVGKLTDPHGLAMRSAWVGTDNKGDAGGFRWSSPFGDGGIFASKWFNAQYDDQIKKFALGIGQFDSAAARYMTPEQIARVTGTLAGSKQYDFGMENTDPSAYLGKIFKDRIDAIFAAVDPELKKLLDGFEGTGEELGAFALQLLELKQTLSGNTIAGLDLAGLKAMQANGEGLADTLARVTGQMAAIQAVGQRESDTLAALEKSLRGAFEGINESVPMSAEAWGQLASTIDLSTERGRALFNVMGNVAGAFQQVQQAVSNAIAGIWASAQGVLGGQFASTFARSKLQATYAQWQQMRGENFSFEEMLQHFQSFTPETLQQGIDATYQQYGAQGVALLQQLWADYAAYQQSLGQSTQTLDTTFQDLTGTVNTFGEQLASARGNLAQYLNGLNQGSLSPLNARDRLTEAKRIYDEQYALAAGGNLDALSGISGYHSAYLQALQAVEKSSPAYVAGYTSSFNQLAALTNGAVQPLTSLVFQTVMTAQADAMQVAQAETKALLTRLIEPMVVVANAVAADGGLITKSPSTEAALTRLNTTLETAQAGLR